MTDHEMLIMVYGAMKSTGRPRDLLEILEKHLFENKGSESGRKKGTKSNQEPSEGTAHILSNSDEHDF